MNKKFIFTVLSALSLIGYGVFVFAAPPSPGGYTPGTELDPDCNPGQSISNGDPYDCFVKSSIMSANNGLTATGSNIQLGGVLLQNTTIDANGNSFFVANNGNSIYSVHYSGNTYTGFDNSGLGTISGASMGILNMGTNKGASMTYSYNDGSYRKLGFYVDNSIISMSNNQAGPENIGSGIYIENWNGILKFSGDNDDDSIHSLWQNTDESDLSGNTHNEIAVLWNNGNWSWPMYLSSRDDSGSQTPVNFLYTNSSGDLLSAPLASLGNSSWSLTGNSGTIAGTNFIGTTDPEDFVIKVNNVESGRFTNSTEFNQYSVFLGHNAGVGASSAHRSNFFGRDSGGNAINASGSNFLGELSGNEAINASGSNFIGAQSGRYATNANYSNFFGDSAGYSASEANNSIFIGRSAGSSANFASNSIFLGQQAGMSDIVNNTGNLDDFSILIGKLTSTGGFSNSIAIGGSATNTSSNQFMIGSTTRPIDTTIWKGSASTECTLTTGTGVSCTSDERLKTNIEDLTSDTLDKVLNLKTVTYNWIQNPDSPTQIGFLAQDLEQYFPELVATNGEGKKSVYYSQMTPILVEAIREMNVKITDIDNMEIPNTWRDALIAWFGNVENGINDFFTKTSHTETLCVGTNGNETCINKEQFDNLLLNSGTTIVPNTTETVTDNTVPSPIETVVGDVNIDPEIPTTDSVIEPQSEIIITTENDQ